MNSIKIQEKKYLAPSTWDELKPHHLIAFAAATLKNQKLDFVINILIKAFYQIPTKTFAKLKYFQFKQIAPTLYFLFESNQLKNWVIPFIKLPWYTFYFKKLYGPSNRLSNITIKEFRHLEILYQAYQLTKQVRYLNQLVATLYRPHSRQIISNDYRVALNEIEIKSRENKVARLPAKVKQAILLNYEGVRFYIFDKYPNIFPKQKEQSNTPQKKALFDFESIIEGISGGKFGDYFSTQNTPLYTFLNHLENQIIEVQKLKSKK